MVYNPIYKHDMQLFVDQWQTMAYPLKRCNQCCISLVVENTSQHLVLGYSKPWVDLDFTLRSTQVDLKVRST